MGVVGRVSSADKIITSLSLTILWINVSCVMESERNGYELWDTALMALHLDLDLSFFIMKISRFSANLQIGGLAFVLIV